MFFCSHCDIFNHKSFPLYRENSSNGHNPVVFARPLPFQRCGVLVLARWHTGILHNHLPTVLQAFRYGNQGLFNRFTDLGKAPLWVHFHALQKEFNKVESWGKMDDVDDRIGKNDNLNQW